MGRRGSVGSAAMVSRTRTARAARKRKRRMARVEHDLTPAQWLALQEAWGRCAYCGEPDVALQRDCVLAISRGGRYTLDNVVPACRSCNASKCNEEVTGWMRRRKPSQAKPAIALLAHAPKYVVLGFFLFMMWVAMDVRTVSEFLASPYNHVADARLLAFFASPSATAIVVIGAFAVGSLFVRHLWCRFFCPYGAFLGLVAWTSPQRVTRDAATCTSCKRCTQVCPSAIRVHTELVVLTPECTGCMDCVTVCPVESCLTVGRPAKRGWSPLAVPALVLVTLLGAYALARPTGHWYSRVPAAEFAERYRAEAVERGGDSASR